MKSSLYICLSLVQHFYPHTRADIFLYCEICISRRPERDTRTAKKRREGASPRTRGPDLPDPTAELNAGEFGRQELREIPNLRGNLALRWTIDLTIAADLPDRSGARQARMSVCQSGRVTQVIASPVPTGLNGAAGRPFVQHSPRRKACCHGRPCQCPQYRMRYRDRPNNGRLAAPGTH